MEINNLIDIISKIVIDEFKKQQKVESITCADINYKIKGSVSLNEVYCKAVNLIEDYTPGA